MDLFEDKDTFKDKVEDHSGINIPDNLGWDKMGPGILEGVKKRKKRRRLLIWWWSVGIALIGFSLLGWWFNNPSIPTSPINSPTIEYQKEALPSKEGNKIAKETSKKQEIHLVSQEKTTTPQKETINVLNNTTKREGKINQFNSGLLPQVNVNPVTPSLTQLQNNQKIQLKDTLARETNNTKPRLTIKIERLPISTNLLAYETLDAIIPITPIIKKTVSAKWQVEIGGGANWWAEGLKSQGSIDPINTPQIGWQFNARINRDLTKFFTIKLGLQFQNLRYKSAFEHREEVAVYQPNTEDVIFINSFTGERNISYRDSIPGLQTRKFQHFNQHQTLQIPFLAGFRIGKKRWKYAVHTGLSLQFFQQSTGRIALTKGSVFDLPNKTVYPTTFKINYLVETQLSYQVNKKLSIFNRWSTDKSLTNWLSKESKFQQRPKVRYSTFGLAWVL